MNINFQHAHTSKVDINAVGTSDLGTIRVPSSWLKSDWNLSRIAWVGLSAMRLARHVHEILDV